MKASRVKRFANNYLLPHMPGFAVHGHLVYAEPLEYLLRGFCFMSSGFDADHIYLEAFVLPLYEPVDHLPFIFGDRIGSYSVTDENEELVMREVLKTILRKGIPFLKKLWTPAHIVKESRKFRLNTNPYIKEARAGALILRGDYRSALAQTLDLIACMERAILENTLITWYQPIKDRAVLMADLLKNDPQAARAKLDEYRDFTVKSLHPKYLPRL